MIISRIVWHTIQELQETMVTQEGKNNNNGQKFGIGHIQLGNDLRRGSASTHHPSHSGG